MSGKFKGIICGVLSAVCYGTNPLGALPLYAEGINAVSVLFYRYFLAFLILGTMLACRKESVRLGSRQFFSVAGLGVLFVISSITLFYSFLYMAAGLASTILFVYPVMVAVLMAIFFKERVTPITVTSIILALSGIALLYKGDGEETLSSVGVGLVMASSLAYAIYIIAVNRLKFAISSQVLTLYVLAVGTLVIVGMSLLSGNPIQLLHGPMQWSCAVLLAVMPTVLSLIFIAIAIREIGSTPTAIMGALEPVTALVIGIVIFGEAFSLRLGVGIVLILTAVTLIVLGKSLNIKKIGRAMYYVEHYIHSHWRWKF